MTRRTILLFVGLFLSACASGALAEDLDSLKLAPDSLQLLGGRLQIQMPKRAKLEPRPVNIMAAPESPEEETRVVLNHGKKRLVLMVQENFSRAGEDFAGEIKKTVKRWARKGESVKTTPLQAGEGLRVYQTTITPVGKDSEAVLVCSAWVANTDGTVQVLHAYANPEAAEDLADAESFYTRVLRSLRPGEKRLSAKAHTAKLNVYSKTKKLAVSLPDGYVVTTQPGPDFLVHRVRKVGTFGSPLSTIGIYVGNHPSLHHKKPEYRKAKVEEVDGVMLGQKVSWYNYSMKGRFSMEAIVPVKKIEDTLMDGLMLHIFFSCSSEEELESLTEIVENTRLVEVTTSSRDNREP